MKANNALLTCAKAPCGSCPYRRDVPAGVWEAGEYAKLPPYDGETWEQPPGAFMCHQQNGKLCAGWVGTHDPHHLLALRLNPAHPSVYSYHSPVPLFASGAEAAQHGMAGVVAPGTSARRLMMRLEQKRLRRSLA